MRATCILLAAAVLAVTASAAIEAHRVTELPDYGALLSANYAGYINMTDTGRKTFYWFEESQGNPAADPMVVWLTGGPGCSSLLAFATEMGPYTIRLGGNFEKNDFAWSKYANVLYIESPAGVGFSTDSVPPQTWTDNMTAAANYAFLEKFFAAYPKFAGHKLYLTGESYAGHYIPQLAFEVYKHDNAIKKNMQGFMVGNPCTGTIGCGNADPTLDPFLQMNGFRPLNASIPVLPNAPGAYAYDPYDLLVPSCHSKSVSDQTRFPHPVTDAFKRKLGSAPAPYGPCAQDFTTAWYNRADVKAAIHADVKTKWEMCSNTLKYDIQLSGVVDIYKTLMDKTAWHIMVYSGLDDSVVNMAQTQTILNEMQRPLKVDKWQPWNLPYWQGPGTQLGGFFIEWDRMSWAGVRNSGHMVPMYNPPSGLEMLRSFLAIGRPGRM
jgi:carboxypeptidase C (cathepsin A)